MWRKEIERQKNQRQRIDNRIFEVDLFLEYNAEFASGADGFVVYEENKSGKKRINELWEEVNKF